MYHTSNRSQYLQALREKLGIKLGMSKEEALEKFMQWKADKRTCERCEEDKLSQFCDLRSICKEAEDGAIKDRAVNIGKEPGRSVRHLKVNALRHEAKRVSVGKHRR